MSTLGPGPSPASVAGRTSYSTQFVNAAHPEVVALALRLRTSARGDTAFSSAAFAWVRDEIKYTMPMNWTVPVETTLATRNGNCFQKACLLVALLRAGGPSAEFYTCLSSFAEIGNGTAPQWICHNPTLMPSQVSVHAAVALYLQGRWIHLDPTTDMPLARGLSFDGLPSSVLTFDAEDPGSNARLPGEYTREGDIDRCMFKRPRYSAGTSLLTNVTCEFVRSYGSMYPNVESMEAPLTQYLLVNYPKAVTIGIPDEAEEASRIAAKDRGGSAGGASMRGPVDSVYCDCEHPMVVDLAARLRSKTGGDDAAFAIAAFNWVRDEIKYLFTTSWSVGVDVTMGTKVGLCSTKSSVLTALLRAGGLRAEFYVMPVDATTMFSLQPPWIRSQFSTASVHLTSAVHLHGRWIKLDPSYERGFTKPIERFFKQGLPNPNSLKLFVEFDGKNDAISLPERWAEKMRLYDNIDKYMDKKSNQPKEVIYCANIVFEFIRVYGFGFSTIDQMLSAMDMYFITHHTGLLKTVLSMHSRESTLSKL